jgi:hypothetical protein
MCWEPLAEWAPLDSDFGDLSPPPTKRAASFADLSPIEPNDVKKPKSTKPPTVRKSSLPRAPGKH